MIVSSRNVLKVLKFRVFFTLTVVFLFICDFFCCGLATLPLRISCIFVNSDLIGLIFKLLMFLNVLQFLFVVFVSNFCVQVFCNFNV